MKVLIAPLNWGLGHASRCVPLVRRHLAAGDEVVLGGDGDSLLLLRREFPRLRAVPLAPLRLRYDARPVQRAFYARAVWQLLRFTVRDYCRLRRLLRRESFDLVLSDNRFGLHNRRTRCVYLTHQLYVILPQRLRFLQPAARAVHYGVCRLFDEVWVPDYADPVYNLSGALSHGGRMDRRVRYIGALSRLEPPAAPAACRYDIVAVLSGLEPQRTIWEQALIAQYAQGDARVLIVRGLMGAPATPVTVGKVTLLPRIGDALLAEVLTTAKQILARSGYSTIMDLDKLHLLPKARLCATPDQSEQEYLARHTAALVEHFHKDGE